VLFLEGDHKIFLHDTDLHRVLKDVIVLVFNKERIWGVREVLVGQSLPFANDISWYLPIHGQLPTDLNNQVLNHFDHRVGIFTWQLLVRQHEALHFLDRHRVEEHADELQEQDDC
jgi:hypothetical protein